MADVFISYAKTARPQTEGLAIFLAGEGYSVWWDAALLSGDSFRSVILKELDAAKAVIVIWTPASVQSEWVISEAERAAAAGKLITLRTRDIPIQSIPMPFGVRHTELVDNRAAVLAALQRDGVRPSKVTASPARAAPVAAADIGGSGGGAPASWSDLGKAAGAIAAVAAALIGGVVLINSFNSSDPRERLFSKYRVFTDPLFRTPSPGGEREGVEAEWGTNRAAPQMDAIPPSSSGGEGPTN
jgi:hypothetical protein